MRVRSTCSYHKLKITPYDKHPVPSMVSYMMSPQQQSLCSSSRKQIHMCFTSRKFSSFICPSSDSWSRSNESPHHATYVKHGQNYRSSPSRGPRNATALCALLLHATCTCTSRPTMRCMRIASSPSPFESLPFTYLAVGFIGLHKHILWY